MPLRANARPRPGAPRGTLRLGRDILIGSRRRRSHVPNPTVRIDLPIGRLRQRQMRGPTLSSDPDRYTVERTSG